MSALKCVHHCLKLTGYFRYVRTIQNQNPVQSTNSLPRKNKVKKASHEKKQVNSNTKFLHILILIFLAYSPWSPSQPEILGCHWLNSSWPGILLEFSGSLKPSAPDPGKTPLMQPPAPSRLIFLSCDWQGWYTGRAIAPTRASRARKSLCNMYVCLWAQYTSSLPVKRGSSPESFSRILRFSSC